MMQTEAVGAESEGACAATQSGDRWDPHHATCHFAIIFYSLTNATGNGQTILLTFPTLSYKTL
ncbi:conserved hypothetical protein [Ricinus communis]|uniref:Uncharacterized protein n=1 Tax=Ricinus communis TaxID=3988 RepID=B9SJK0_RICCO|nr:conserved hypothetical protein [Ricinus communis]